MERQRESRLCGGGRGTQREDGVAFGAGGAGEDRLAVLLDDALGQRRALGVLLSATDHGAQPRPHGPGAQHAVDFAPGDVAGVRDAPGGLVHLAQQGVGVEQAECGGDLVLFLERKPVGGAAGRQVQRVPYVEEPAAGVGESLARGVGEPGGGDGAQRGGVAQSAAGLLEVGFQEVLQLALPFGAFGAELPEFGEAFRRLVAPVGQDGGAQGGGESEVPGDVPGVQEAQLDLEVLAGGAAGLGRSADGVVEGDAEVPHGVPEPVGEGGDGLGIAAVVQQEQVEVAARGQFASSVAADRDEGDPAELFGACGEQAGEPVVREPGEGGTARRSDRASSVRRRSRAAA